MNENRSFCIHGHFYQPPREDVFTGRIPEEAGAAPYHNWNERVLEMCYRPNANLRNFSKLSFNIGPTLADWLALAAPEVLARIVDEDEMNQAIYGAGNAMAQPFNHRILPLANPSDKRTQVKWGVTAFETLYGRYPEGMWLPETAVDTETLLILAENNIKFTILAPWQVEVLDGQSPYSIDVGNGKSITAFVYHGALSSTLSFDTFATGNADAFAEFYLKPEINLYDPDQLILIATDGELYGHHQPFRDQFLSYLLNGANTNLRLKPIWPALWLKQHEIKGKARVIQNTSWSCHHGVGRWQDQCGCTPTSSWKAPLKKGFDVLNEQIFADYCDFSLTHGIEPLNARDEYIKVKLGAIDFKRWLNLISTKTFSEKSQVQLKIAFETQYLCQKMFTSCGWFFDSLERIEPLNNIQYAAHSASQMNKLNGKDYTELITPILEEAVSEESKRTAADLFLSAYRRFSSIS